MNQIPHLPMMGNADTTCMSAEQFVRRLYDLLPKPMAGSILLGTQHPSDKFTQVGYDPNAPFPQGVTHINSALFEPDGAEWRERGSLARQQAWLFLDDWDTKVQRSQLQPTYLLETNPATGSKQAVYVYSTHVDIPTGFGMSIAAAEAGLSDAFIKRKPSAWHRLPGSLPPSKRIDREKQAAKAGTAPDYRPARLIEFSGVTYTYEQVAQGLGISPQTADVPQGKAGKGYDPATGDADPVLLWMGEAGMIPRGRPDSGGFRNVDCINKDSHSTGTKVARYVPPNKLSHAVYFCHHEHCADLAIKDLRQFVAARGGPSESEALAYARQVEPFVVPDCMPDAADVPLPASLTQALLVPQLPIAPVTPTEVQTLDVWPASTLYGLSVPQRVWHVEDMVPDATVTLLGGDGGTGKSLLALQLAASTALGHPWIGVETRQGAALYLSAEDDKAELHRRIVDIAKAEDVALSDLSAMHVASLAGSDALLATAQPNGVMIATVLLGLVREKVAALRPKLVVLDTLADLFGGNENDRSQARQFISMLRGVAIEFECAVVVLAHPSLSGMASGTGSSGSTGWNNSVRSRLYLKRDVNDTHDLDPDARVLEVMKSNYGRIGAEVRLRWQRGVFVTGTSMEYGGGDTADVQADNTFLSLLDEFTRQDRPVSTRTGANYAPAKFAQHHDAGGVKKKGFARAMERLLTALQIEEISYGPPSKQRYKLQRVQKQPSNALPT